MVADNMYLVFRENNSVLGVIGCGQGDDCSIGKKYRKQNDGFTTSPTLSSPGGVFEVQHRSVYETLAPLRNVSCFSLFVLYAIDKVVLASFEAALLGSRKGTKSGTGAVGG